MNPRTYKSFILFHNKTKTKCSWIWWLVVDMPTTFFGHENQNNFFSYGLQKIILKIYVKIKILLNLLNYKMTQWMMKCHKSNMKMKLVDVTKMNTLWFCADREKILFNLNELRTNKRFYGKPDKSVCIGTRGKT